MIKKVTFSLLYFNEIENHLCSFVLMKFIYMDSLLALLGFQ